jgi:hypothetical protein
MKTRFCPLARRRSWCGFPIIRNGLIYVIDIRDGLYVLRYAGPHADEADAISFLEGNSNLGDAGRLAKSGSP